MKPKVIDLFCGIGGFSKGFEKAGFDIVLGVDNWDVALQTFQQNHNNSKIINGDVREIPNEFFKQYENRIDVVIGGPPCQGFSMAGKRDINDKRNTLFEDMIRIVRIIKPKIVILENVVGLLSMTDANGELIKQLIERKLNEIGYGVESRILNASEFGVPQNRRRVIFIGSKIGKIGFPEPSNIKINVGDALGNIPDVDLRYYSPPKTKYQQLMADGQREIFNHKSMSHNSEVLNRIKHVPPGGNWKDIPPKIYNVGGEHSNNYRRLNPAEPSVTLKHATKSMIIHPKFNRVITAREVARLQSFSDSFIIAGTTFEQHQQLANAVPPLLANRIACHILPKLNQNLKTEIQDRLTKFNDPDKLKFIDLFSGIGGFRLAFEANDCTCVFSSDIDKWANNTYLLNFGEYPKGDITKIKSEDIPNHDILCGGFPCQPFSIVGKRKGFSDTRGTLFFEIERILKDKSPSAFLLENVKGLVNHDKGNTFSTIINKLNELGYITFYQVLNSSDYGVPQNRERIYIVGFKNKVTKFEFPKPLNTKHDVRQLLQQGVKGHDISITARKHIRNHLKKLRENKKIDSNNILFATEIRPSRCVFRNDGLSPCLTAKMGTGGNNVPVLVNEERKLTVRECLRIQGYPDNFKIKENNSQSYKQIGNSVSVPVLKLIAKEIIKSLENKNK